MAAALARALVAETACRSAGKLNPTVFGKAPGAGRGLFVVCRNAAQSVPREEERSFAHAKHATLPAFTVDTTGGYLQSSAGQAGGPFTDLQYRLRRFQARGVLADMSDRIPAGAARRGKDFHAERRAERKGAPLRRGGVNPCVRAPFCYLHADDGRLRWAMRSFPLVSSEQVWFCPTAHGTRSASSHSTRCAGVQS